VLSNFLNKLKYINKYNVEEIIKLSFFF